MAGLVQLKRRDRVLYLGELRTVHSDTAPFERITSMSEWADQMYKVTHLPGAPLPYAPMPYYHRIRISWSTSEGRQVTPVWIPNQFIWHERSHFAELPPIRFNDTIIPFALDAWPQSIRDFMCITPDQSTLDLLLHFMSLTGRKISTCHALDGSAPVHKEWYVHGCALGLSYKQVLESCCYYLSWLQVCKDCIEYIMKHPESNQPPADLTVQAFDRSPF
jgi:hypothetical protein